MEQEWRKAQLKLAFLHFDSTIKPENQNVPVDNNNFCISILSSKFLKIVKLSVYGVFLYPVSLFTQFEGMDIF